VLLHFPPEAFEDETEVVPPGQRVRGGGVGDVRRGVFGDFFTVIVSPGGF